VRRTGLAFRRLGSRPNRPDDLGDGSPRHHSRLLPNRRARAQQSTPLLKLGWTTGARGGSKKQATWNGSNRPRPVSRDDLCLMTPPAYRSGISVRQQPRDPFVRAVPMVRIRFPPAASPRNPLPSGTRSSNPPCSSEESANFRSLSITRSTRATTLLRRLAAWAQARALETPDRADRGHYPCRSQQQPARIRGDLAAVKSGHYRERRGRRIGVPSALSMPGLQCSDAYLASLRILSPR
jgi:hypothetical protein